MYVYRLGRCSACCKISSMQDMKDQKAERCARFPPGSRCLPIVPSPKCLLSRLFTSQMLLSDQSCQQVPVLYLLHLAQFSPNQPTSGYSSSQALHWAFRAHTAEALLAMITILLEREKAMVPRLMNLC